MIRVIEYASCYVYSPTGTGAVCERSRLLRTLLKAGDAGFMLKYALRVRQQVADSPPLAGFFGTSDVGASWGARETKPIAKAAPANASQDDRSQRQPIALFAW